MSSIINQFSWLQTGCGQLIPKLRSLGEGYYSMDYPVQYDQVQTLEKVGSLSYRKRLELESEALKKRAADIDTVVAMFDKNPDLEKMLDAMRRLGV